MAKIILRPFTILFFILIGSSLFPVFAQQKTNSYNITLNSFGPVMVGMTVAQGSKALGVPLTKEADQEDECYYVHPKTGYKGIAFMVTNRRISRIDIDDKKYVTDRGAKVGDGELRIKQLYKGMVRVSRHPYDERGHYLEVKVKGSKYSLIFETDGKRVTSYRVGKSEEVSYIEGCS
jgi:hypothetical protein